MSALADPTDADRAQAAVAARTGRAREQFMERIVEWNITKYRLLPNDRLPAVVVVERPAALVTGHGDRATIQVCELDSWVVVRRGSDPGGSDEVVSDAIASYRELVTMQLVDGSWLLADAERIGDWPDLAACPAGT
jgi:hypothetical protein